MFYIDKEVFKIKPSVNLQTDYLALKMYSYFAEIFRRNLYKKASYNKEFLKIGGSNNIGKFNF